MGSPTNIVSNSPAETFKIGQRIAGFLFSGSIVALKGQLGCGKTHLAKGIAAGLNITENLTSPTYTIINEYRLPDQKTALYHIDAYRLNSGKDFEDIGGLEIINSKDICLIEWSERILNLLPPDIISVSFEITGVSSRLIQITGLENL